MTSHRPTSGLVAPSADSAVAGGGDLPARRRIEILVVDDSKLQRRILTSALGRSDYVVREAGSAEEALAICAETPPDLVLSDWMMPGMTGLEFCRAFRAMERDSYGYFILLTSKSEKAEVAEGLDGGADDFLTKPVHTSELRARIAAGERILRMQHELTEKNRMISDALDEIKALYHALDNDLIEARKLQQSLVRDRFQVFSTAHISLLLRPSGHVGGDLVGYFPIDDRTVGLFAIDVSGHGISSALMTARLAGYLSATAPDHNIALGKDDTGRYYAHPLTDVVADLNALVLNEMDTEHYFTMVLAYADLETGQVDMVQAGHPHPLVQRADGSVQQVGSGGLPVGLIRGADYDTAHVTLAPGDRLLLLSDGVTECTDGSGELLGEERLIDWLQGVNNIRGPFFLEALSWHLQSFAGSGDFPDDVSAVIWEFSGRE